MAPSSDDINVLYRQGCRSILMYPRHFDATTFGINAVEWQTFGELYDKSLHYSI